MEETVQMNDAYEILLKRRTVRSFQANAIPGDVMEKIILAGKYAPSAKGMQSRHFTVISNQALLDEIVRTTEQAGGHFLPGHTPFYHAPAVVVVSAPENFKYGREDAACAIQNILLAAWTFGVGSCYICSVLPALRRKEILSKLNLPEDYVPCGCVSLGYPAEKAPEPKPRRADDVTTIL